MTRSQRWVLGFTAVASLMVVLDALVVSTALSTMRVDLHASLAQLEWTVNGYALTFAVLLMTAALLGDRLGRRRVFCLGMGTFAAASVGCSPTVGLLIAFRVLQGAGAAFVMPVALAMLGVNFTGSLRPRALGVFAGVSGLSVPLGPLLGGAVVQGISWPWIFWLDVPTGVVLIALARTRLEETRDPRGDLNVLRVARLTQSRGPLPEGVHELARSNRRRTHVPQGLPRVQCRRLSRR
jgi:MFS family permease